MEELQELLAGEPVPVSRLRITPPAREFGFPEAARSRLRVKGLGLSEEAERP